MSGLETHLPPCKRVAVLGGGASGIGAIKALKEENIEPICFEKSSYLGGTWKYREKPVEGISSVMSTTVINHSKEMGSISNFLIPKEYPNYMKHNLMYKFIASAAEKFDCLRHITFDTEVIKVKKSEDYETTGRWVVTVRNVKNGAVSTDTYDAVIVCNGLLSHPKMASYYGMENFKGKIMHSHSLKTFEEFTGKKIVVIGTGCSALDAAVETSSVAEQVYLSVRTPTTIVSRMGPFGLPIDYCILRRYITFFQSILPTSWASWIIEKLYLQKPFDHKLYGIEPKYPFLSRDPSLNDHIGSKLLTGTVLMRKDIKRFVENGVIFDGEENVTEVDVVIMATGYTTKYPFLEDGVFVTKGDKINMYKCIFPAHLPHHTIAFCGFALPIGPGFPVGELQSRWVAHILSGKGKLPTPKERQKEVDRMHEANSKRFSPSDKMTIRVDFVPYCDDLASQIGAKPNFWRMLFTDPRLFISCIFGPCLPFQYRLYGPHKWPQAREAILTASERVEYPLSQGKRKPSTLKRVGNYLIGQAYIIAIIVFVILCIASSIMSSEDTVFWMFVCYTLTLLAMICKNVDSILVNRSFFN